MAIRLSKAFGSSPETGLGMQMACDLWSARGRADEIRVRSFRVCEFFRPGSILCHLEPFGSAQGRLRQLRPESKDP